MLIKLGYRTLGKRALAKALEILKGYGIEDAKICELGHVTYMGMTCNVRNSEGVQIACIWVEIKGIEKEAVLVIPSYSPILEIVENYGK